MALITTPGDPQANSYVTVAEADSYNASRPFASSWASLSVTDKESALTYAAVVLDSAFIWTGQSTDSVLDPPPDPSAYQLRSWPRVGMFSRNGLPIDSMTIPVELKMAQAELARQLSVTDLTATNDIAVQGIIGVKAGSVSVSFAKNRTAEEEVALQSSQYAYLSKSIPDAVRLLLVPSWYLENAALKNVMQGQQLYFRVDR